MRLSLIGMSGAGKSYWAKRMQSQGYRSIICDNLIAEQLGPLISSSEKSTLGLAAWMGKPDQPGYKEAQAKYLELETKVVTQICDELEQSSESDDKVIIDTTGSLIYLEPQLIKRIKTLSFLVYLRLEENSSQAITKFLLTIQNLSSGASIILQNQEKNPKQACAVATRNC